MFQKMLMTYINVKRDAIVAISQVNQQFLTLQVNQQFLTFSVLHLSTYLWN